MDAFFRTIPSLLESIDDSEEVRNAFIFAAWRRIAGGQILERTAPVKFENKRLTIAVADKTWQRNLESLASQLLFKLNALIGKPLVTFIEFRIDPMSISDRDIKVEKRSENNLSALEGLSPDIADAASAIADPALRQVVMLAAANCLSREK